MVLGKHNVRVERRSPERIARALGNALVAPVIAYVPEGGVDPPTAHMRFPGTITRPDDVVRGDARVARRAASGCTAFATSCSSATTAATRASTQAVAARLNREWAATPVRVHAIAEYYRATETEYSHGAARRAASRDAEIGTHAGLADTSLALAVDPRARAHGPAARGEASAPPTASTAIRAARAPSSAQLGVDAIVAETVAAIRAGRARR